LIQFLDFSSVIPIPFLFFRYHSGRIFPLLHPPLRSDTKMERHPFPFNLGRFPIERPTLFLNATPLLAPSPFSSPTQVFLLVFLGDCLELPPPTRLSMVVLKSPFFPPLSMAADSPPHRFFRYVLPQISFPSWVNPHYTMEVTIFPLRLLSAGVSVVYFDVAFLFPFFKDAKPLTFFPPPPAIPPFPPTEHTNSVKRLQAVDPLAFPFPSPANDPFTRSFNRCHPQNKVFSERPPIFFFPAFPVLVTDPFFSFLPRVPTLSSPGRRGFLFHLSSIF